MEPYIDVNGTPQPRASNINLGGGTAIELRNRILACQTPGELEECGKMMANWIKALRPSQEAREAMQSYYESQAGKVSPEEKEIAQP